MKRIRKQLGRSQARAFSAPPSTSLPDPLLFSTTLAGPASPQMAPVPLARESRLPSQRAWTDLKDVLSALRDGSDYPPFKAALKEVTSAMESIERVGDVNNEFRRITQNLEGFQRIFSQYESEKYISPAMRTTLDAVTSKLKFIEGVIRSKMPAGQLRHILEAPDEVEEILTAFKRFSSLIDKLQLNMGLVVSNYNLNIFGIKEICGMVKITYFA
ncbi:hypothetical protein C8R45DRAFT_1036957 [Mycena sanguinolenta]|nr:hypothetical protein C8R45DRAFT_1036957 [Mycena sanguinolenta]